jgi:hypothetical protein
MKRWKESQQKFGFLGLAGDKKKTGDLLCFLNDKKKISE